MLSVTFKVVLTFVLSGVKTFSVTNEMKVSFFILCGNVHFSLSEAFEI